MPNTPSTGRSGHAKDLASRWAPPVVWMCVIFAASSVPGSNLPGGYSVQGHLAEYAVLVMLALCRGTASLRWALVALAACSLYGVTDELHQAFVPGRMPDVMDWATDTIGAAIGIAIAAAWLRWRGSARAGASRLP
jgi:hypothetical protein